MIDTPPNHTAEPEAYEFPIFLLGGGSGAVPKLVGRDNVTLARTGTGAVTITFVDDPGPTFLGGAFGYQDTSGTLTNSAGWSVVLGAYTAPTGGAQGTLTLLVANASNAAADLATTQLVKLALTFKRADAKL